MRYKTLQAIFSKRMLVMLGYGFSSGLPRLAVAGTLQLWLEKAGFDISTLGFITLVGLPYTLKILWAPFFDRYNPPFLGRRTGWILMTQILLMLCFGGFYFVHPEISLLPFVLLSFLTAFFSSSQDILIDAHRRDVLDDHELGLGTGLYMGGYRLGMIISSPVAIGLYTYYEPQLVYLGIGLFMLLGIATTLFAPQVQHSSRKLSLEDTLLNPLRNLYQVHKKSLYIILVFILLYKIGDGIASTMTLVYYKKLGYEYASISLAGKLFGMISAILGGIIGGCILLKIDIIKGLLYFGYLQAISTLCFLFLGYLPVHFAYLAAIVSFENVTAGMGSAALGAYMAMKTNKEFSASQMAVFTGIMSVPLVLLGSPSGVIIKIIGWDWFFILSTLLAIPGLVLLSKGCLSVKTGS